MRLEYEIKDAFMPIFVQAFIFLRYNYYAKEYKMRIKKKAFVCLLIISVFAGTVTEVSADAYRYYDKLNSRQKQAYKKMEQQIDAAVSAPLSVELKCTYSDAIRSIEAMSADRPDLFSGNITIDFETSDSMTKPTFSDLNGKALSKKLRKIVNNQKLKGSDNFETTKNIHDFMIKHLDYDFSSDKSSNDKFSMKGALLNKKAVCEGYARTFKYICDKYEIPCVLVVGSGNDPSKRTASERHMWNYVKLDGYWYAVDTTWDDNLTGKNHICYDYFLVGANTKDYQNIPFSKSHIRGASFLNFDVDNVKGFNYPNLNKDSFFGKDSNIYEYLKANYK